ncbi:hypothetical protein EZV62_001755 [Acer yangbiense]|uniref:Uncharacterized protein n=1 Tax=Acer yangbiense TaxID=1000413 RepID=A0A5C7IXK9_9ROSI|nr:hypothetical protein EZV62_001755 [Acer yangbiense]
MSIQTPFLFGLFILTILLRISFAALITPSYGTASLNRSSFPPGFIFGTASSAYQETLSVEVIIMMKSLFILWVLIFVDFLSMKVQQMKVAEDQVYGILSLIDIQVPLSLSLSKNH